MAHNESISIPVIPIDEGKNPRLFDVEAKDGIHEVVVETELDSSDNDDALKLAGTSMHHFDDAYYARLKRKIVRLPLHSSIEQNRD